MQPVSSSLLASSSLSSDLPFDLVKGLGLHGFLGQLRQDGLVDVGHLLESEAPHSRFSIQLSKFRQQRVLLEPQQCTVMLPAREAMGHFPTFPPQCSVRILTRSCQSPTSRQFPGCLLHQGDEHLHVSAACATNSLVTSFVGSALVLRSSVFFSGMLFVISSLSYGTRVLLAFSSEQVAWCTLHTSFLLQVNLSQHLLLQRNNYTS